MNDIKLPDFDDNHISKNLSISKSTPPEEVLESLINELQSPLNSIKGWVKILSIESDKDLHPKALASISLSIEKIEHIEETIKQYLSELRRS